MSKKNKNSKSRSLSNQKRTPFWVWLLGLVPVLSSAVFLAIVAGKIPFIDLEIFYTNEAGEVAWHTSGLLVLVLTMVIWAGCGFVYGYFRAKMPVAVVAFHVLPIVCTLVYTVCIIGLSFGATGVENIALFSAIGMGLFSYIDSFVYGIIYLGNLGLYLDLIFMILTFIVGFALGKSKKLKA